MGGAERYGDVDPDKWDPDVSGSIPRLAGKILLGSVALGNPCAMRTVPGSVCSGVRPFSL